MERILKKYTTIPQHLYVNRSADLQLKRIIEEMQRPGYVLVARQMGKTNLLFNAKRTLENANRLFAYVDLSNLYNDERECYRNIVNNIIEPNFHIFSSIENEILEIRTKNLPAHNEYSRSLVKILECFQGDLVIILDEIDALKSIGYSDNIFAQIRSNYFSRTNYPVLERLTYVLSGVIEPTELIKDKNKSPFNIGDKIYLDDFNRPEYNAFIQKSNLPISDDIIDEIYNWTNGNPRLTFDICSEIESYLLDTGSIKLEDVSTIIRKKYLETFDIAPIDHIRELVKSNNDIQEAIMYILNSNIDLINDDLLRKLYLFGIVSSDGTIKNKILASSLSIEWLSTIQKNAFTDGLRYLENKEYLLSLHIFEEILILSKNEAEKESSRYFAGVCLFKIKDFEKALKYFSFNFKDEVHLWDSLAFRGICLLKTMNDNKEGLTLLNEVFQKGNITYAYLYTVLTLAEHEKDNNLTLHLFEKLFDCTFLTTKINDDELRYFRTISLFYQAEIYKKRNESYKAILKIEMALKYATLKDSIALSFYKSQLFNENDYTEKEQIVDTIIENKLKFEERILTPISFNEECIYKCLIWVFDKNNLQLFEKLLLHTSKFLIPNKSKYEISLEISRYASYLDNSYKKKDILGHFFLNSPFG